MIWLCQDILSRWPIPQTRIVGHSDIAPSRKADPGEHFPWQRLAGEKIGLWPLGAGDASAPGLAKRALASCLSNNLFADGCMMKSVSVKS